jgi:hypothetical protein
MGSLCGVRSQDETNQIRSRQRLNKQQQATVSITKPPAEDKFRDMEEYTGISNLPRW